MVQTGSFCFHFQVEKMASLYNIHLRTGCFCNTGACQRYLGLSNEQVLSNLRAGHVCGDQMDLINGFPTGAVRISFGYMSNFNDAKIFLYMIVECFVEESKKKCTVKEIDDSSGEKIGGRMFKDMAVVSCSVDDIGLTKTVEQKSQNPAEQLRCQNDTHFLEKKEDSKDEDEDFEKSPFSPVCSSPEYQKDDNSLHYLKAASGTRNDCMEVCHTGSHCQEKSTHANNPNNNETNFCSYTKNVAVQRLCLYPIKSCAAFEVGLFIILLRLLTF